MRRQAGLLVPAAAGALAAVLAAVAAGAAGAGAGAAVLIGLAVLLVAGVQVALVRSLRVARNRIDKLATKVEKGARPAPVVHPAPAAAAVEDQATADVLGTTWVDHKPVPPEKLRFMAESPERYVRQGRELADLIADHAPWPAPAVLDVGSGYGRLAVGLLGRDDFEGRYTGFDILKRHITWCGTVITGFDERFAFHHQDVRNERYNPKGTLDPDHTVFPVEDDSADAITMFSVFTHLYRGTVERYLEEIRRTLRPGGVAVTTWLLFDDDRLAAVSADSSAYPLKLVGADGSRYMLEEDPLRAIGFPIDEVRAMAAKAGLEVGGIQLGHWTGGAAAPGQQFQDLVLLTRA